MKTPYHAAPFLCLTRSWQHLRKRSHHQHLATFTCRYSHRAQLDRQRPMPQIHCCRHCEHGTVPRRFYSPRILMYEPLRAVQLPSPHDIPPGRSHRPSYVHASMSSSPALQQRLSHGTIRLAGNTSVGMVAQIFHTVRRETLHGEPWRHQGGSAGCSHTICHT